MGGEPLAGWPSDDYRRSIDVEADVRQESLEGSRVGGGYPQILANRLNAYVRLICFSGGRVQVGSAYNYASSCAASKHLESCG
ncbi:hypothetical protein A5734_16825 [Mycolicibacterium fortuitum]|nr:hypothetical protein A5734_16825 [Mycolicibacterium fortuitum]